MIPVPPANVQIYAAQLHAKHDAVNGVAARIDKAAAILIAGDVTTDGSKFMVLSGKGDGTGYSLADGQCTCPDYANGAPVIGAAKWCKHKLAAAMLKKHIRESIQPRIKIGQPRNINQLTRGPVEYLYRVDESLIDFHQLTVRLNWSDQIFDFQPATDADYIALARWLENAPPLPTKKPSIFDEWRKDASAGDSVVMPFLEWQNLYGHLYSDMNIHQ